MGYQASDTSSTEEPLVLAPQKKPLYRRGGFWCIVIFLCILAALIPPLVIFRDRLGMKPYSPFSDPPFWNGTGPNDNPFGTCFTIQATAFQPNWKEQQTSTWCGAQFNRTSPIFALPLINMSRAVGSDEPVTHDVNRTLWESMTRNWCGAEAMIRGPDGREYRATYGDANTWTTVDLNIGLFETVKGVPIGTYANPDEARWMDNVRVCFTGNRTDVFNGYPYSYP